MLKTTDIREWIASLGIAEDEHMFLFCLIWFLLNL